MAHVITQEEADATLSAAYLEYRNRHWRKTMTTVWQEWSGLGLVRLEVTGAVRRTPEENRDVPREDAGR